jgi:hypothetical protein
VGRLSVREARASVCRGCGARILWVKTKKGASMPVDVVQKTIVTVEGEVVSGFESHFASCPEASSFRKKDSPNT